MSDLPKDKKELEKADQNQLINRIDAQYISSELASIFNFEKGIFYTIKALLTQPGQSIKTFLYSERNRLVKPIGFIIICSLVYILAKQVFHYDDAYMNYSEIDWGGPITNGLMEWISNNYGLANILLAFFIGFWLKILFRRYPYNIFEILVMLLFLMGMQMLMLTILGMMDSLSGLEFQDIGINLAIIYVCWGIGQFFDKKKKTNYFKALMAYALGLTSFIFSSTFIGFILDYFYKIMT